MVPDVNVGSSVHDLLRKNLRSSSTSSSSTKEVSSNRLKN
jgi:hypothetical protein